MYIVTNRNIKTVRTACGQKSSLTCDMYDISELARELQSSQQVSLSMPPALNNLPNSSDRNNMLDSGMDINGSMTFVNFFQFLLNHSLRGREREMSYHIIVVSQLPSLTWYDPPC